MRDESERPKSSSVHPSSFIPHPLAALSRSISRWSCSTVFFSSAFSRMSCSTMAGRVIGPFSACRAMFPGGLSPLSPLRPAAGVSAVGLGTDSSLIPLRPPLHGRARPEPRAECRFPRLQHSLPFPRHPDYRHQQSADDCGDDEKRAQGILKSNARSTGHLHGRYSDPMVQTAARSTLLCTGETSVRRFPPHFNSIAAKAKDVRAEAA